MLLDMSSTIPAPREADHLRVIQGTAEAVELQHALHHQPKILPHRLRLIEDIGEQVAAPQLPGRGDGPLGTPGPGDLSARERRLHLVSEIEEEGSQAGGSEVHRLLERRNSLFQRGVDVGVSHLAAVRKDQLGPESVRVPVADGRCGQPHWGNVGAEHLIQNRLTALVRLDTDFRAKVEIPDGDAGHLKERPLGMGHVPAKGSVPPRRLIVRCMHALVLSSGMPGARLLQRLRHGLGGGEHDRLRLRRQLGGGHGGFVTALGVVRRGGEVAGSAVVGVAGYDHLLPAG